MLKNKKRTHRGIVFVCIALTVVLFNLIAVFGSDILLHDDPAMYREVKAGRFPLWMRKANSLGAYEEWLAWNIMAYSPQLARGLYVLFLMVPISFCFYYFFHFKFGFSRLSAFTAAVLPNILPHQWQIPAGINMSYPLWGLLFALFSLIVGFYYQEKTGPADWVRLAGAAVLYLISTQLMEQSLFLFPALMFAFAGYTRFNRKHVWLISLFAAAAAVKTVQIMIHQRKILAIVPVEAMVDRIGMYFKWAFPSPEIAPGYLAVLYLGLIITGFILYLKRPAVDNALNVNFLHMKKKVYPLYLYSFFICWAVCTVLIFISMTRVFTPRYTYISAFALNALLIFSIYTLLNRGVFRKYKVHVFVFTGLILFSGFARYANLKERYSPANEKHAVIVRDLNKRKMPRDAQIVIAGVTEFPVGWFKASGYFKYALKRDDVDGLIGPLSKSGYYNFYDHFNPLERKFGRRYALTGLSIDRPVFFYSMNSERKRLDQHRYALRWKGKTKNAPWTILIANKKSGKIRPFLSGTGMEEYLAAAAQLRKKRIYQKDILWGGPPFPNESMRLEKLELDPKRFQSGFLYNTFSRLEPARVEEFLAISNNRELITDTVCFGNRFRLVSYLPDEVTEENGAVTPIIHFLLESLKKRKYVAVKLRMILIKNGKDISEIRAEFCHPRITLKPGNYIFGSVKMPGDKLKIADHLGISIAVIRHPEKIVPLRIRGNYRTERKGYRLLLPIDKFLPPDA